MAENDWRRIMMLQKYKDRFDYAYLRMTNNSAANAIHRYKRKPLTLTDIPENFGIFINAWKEYASVQNALSVAQKHGFLNDAHDGSCFVGEIGPNWKNNLKLGNFSFDETKPGVFGFVRKTPKGAFVDNIVNNEQTNSKTP